MFKQLKEEDFYVFSGPLASGRQSPDGIAGGLLIASALTTLVLAIGNVFVFIDRIEPAHKNVILIDIVITSVGLVTVLISFIFSFKYFYETRQAMQYLISIWMSQFLFGHLIYWIMLYIMFDGQHFHHSLDVEGYKIVVYIVVTFLLGFILFMGSFIHLVIKIRKGHYQKDTFIAKMRESVELNIEQYKWSAIRIAMIFVSSIVAVMSWLEVTEVETLTLVTLGTTLFVTMCTILPEQLIILYCIKRFDNFNFKNNADND